MHQQKVTMNIQVLCRNKGKQALVEAAANWIAQELKFRKSKFELTISFERGLKNSVGARGLAFILKDKNYIVTLDSRMDFDSTIRTLCHEMVHVKQFVRGQYKTETNRGRIYHFWKGTKYYNTNYYESPWEIEAATKEGLLALKLHGILAKCMK